MALKLLPAVLLKGLVLLPNNEIKLEFALKEERKVIDKATMFHNNQLLIISSLDDITDKERLPKIALKCHVKDIQESSILKVSIECLERVMISKYIEDPSTNVLEGIIADESLEIYDDIHEKALLRLLVEAIETYAKRADYLNNEILNKVLGAKNIATMTDIFVSFLPITLERRTQYLETLSPYERAEMLLNDINTESEVIKLEEKIESKLKQQLDDNQKEYILREKIRLIKEELGDISSKDMDVENFRNKIKALKAPKKIKNRLNEELKKYEYSVMSSPESAIIRNYIETLLKLPWKIASNDNYDFTTVLDKLSSSHYGLDNVKQRILEYLAVSKFKTQPRSTVLCLVGPPGTGKTSLAKSIAEAINRHFAKITVGGVNDEAELIGHRRTYIGANPGRIINELKKVGVNNPVFLIDEIDKMTKDYKGDPSSVLLEVLDPEQNALFSDNYIEEEFDLSNVFFICTANSLMNIPHPLLDRLEVIELSAYTEYEKLDIVKKHIVPKLLNNFGLNKYNIVIKDETVKEIINGYTKEAGVRELERLISTIYRKIAVEILNSKTDTFIINNKNLSKYLGKVKFFNNSTDTENEIGVVNGLAYTSYGGDVLPIEVTFYPGKGELILTGKLGEVMRESAKIALSYIKSNYQGFGIDYELLTKNDIHIHAPEGAIAKDGPSAGITLVTAIISAFTKQRVSNKLGMTGEITLSGNVLPIGGLKEKAIGAYRAGVRTIIIPEQNMRDLDEVPVEIKDKLTFISVNKYSDVSRIALENYKVLNTK